MVESMVKLNKKTSWFRAHSEVKVGNWTVDSTESEMILRLETKTSMIFVDTNGLIIMKFVFISYILKSEVF